MVIESTVQCSFLNTANIRPMLTQCNTISYVLLVSVYVCLIISGEDLGYECRC